MTASATNVEPTDYTTWDHSALVSRVHELEQQLRTRTAAYQTSHPPDLSDPPKSEQPSNGTFKPLRPFDPSRHSTRHVALKFSYLGQNYNGFEHANGNRTPLPTVEEVLWKALRKARLIWPPSEESFDVQHAPAARMKHPVHISWEGCQYSKCGRTDRGVSAFGQVIGIRVRSNRPRGGTSSASERPLNLENNDASIQNGALLADDVLEASDELASDFDHVKDELPYIAILNGILPSDIRVLAWCPNPPSAFDARFSCGERRYKYFFTNPAFAPTPGAIGLQDAQGRQEKQREGWLDIEAMREGAKLLVGSHDFRNVCKVDPSKQMTNFTRRITYADIEVVDQQRGSKSFSNWTQEAFVDPPTPSGRDLYTSSGLRDWPQVLSFNVHGNAFLWHQVRCMASILFLIGQRLEKPSLISKLLNVDKTSHRPAYEMAVEAPLVLWDCIFPQSNSAVIEESLDWIYAGDARGLGPLSNKGDTKFGLGGIVEEIWMLWRKRKMDEILSSTLLDLAVNLGDGTSWARGGFRDPESVKSRSQKVFEGRDGARYIGKYVPVMQKGRMDSVEVQNAKWRVGQGARRQPKLN